MTPGEIERNLMILIAPDTPSNGDGWRFADPPAAVPDGAEATTVYTFAKKELLQYLLFRRRAGSRRQGGCREVLYLNDGLLSSLFDVHNSNAYRVFAARHLPPKRGVRQRLVALLPPMVRAEKRFVVLSPAPPAQGSPPPILAQQDFMFFSNPGGKLLLTCRETLRSGRGTLFKTTATPSYAAVMEKEFATMRGVAALQREDGTLPRVGERLRAGERVFYREAYLPGKSLRDRIHELSHADRVAPLCDLIDELDAWFERYRAAFTAAREPLSSLYDHLFPPFTALYGKEPDAPALLSRARRVLSRCGWGEVVTPITAHNDLWPGNFVVGEGGLVAIDWERAAPGRAPFFDYYWMIISAALEHLVCRIGRVEYGRAFRLFLKGEDRVARHAAAALVAFLERLGVERELHQEFLFLFLMEWSVQGYLALGHETSMDRLAFQELLSFADSRGMLGAPGGGTCTPTPPEPHPGTFT